MAEPYLFFKDLAQQVEIPQDGILSRTLYQDEHVKAVLFDFDKGQDLSEHTASIGVRRNWRWAMRNALPLPARGST